jgi:hypothetical protein
MRHYQPIKFEPGNWGYTTPVGEARYLFSEEDARREAEATRRHDLDDARANRGPFASTLRAYFGAEAQTQTPNP